MLVSLRSTDVDPNLSYHDTNLLLGSKWILLFVINKAVKLIQWKLEDLKINIYQPPRDKYSSATKW